MPFTSSVVWLSGRGASLDQRIPFQANWKESQISAASIIFVDGSEEPGSRSLLAQPGLLTGKVLLLYDFQGRDSGLDALINLGCRIQIFDSICRFDDVLNFVDSELREQSRQRVYRSLFELKKSEQKMLIRKSEDLEDLVNQRTQFAMKSNEELKSQLTSLKRINSFLRDLGRLETLRDLVFHLTQELKGFFGVHRIYLALQSQNKNQWVVHHLVDKGYRLDFCEVSDLPRLSDEDLRGALATATSRPVLRLKKRSLPSLRESFENYLLIEESGFGVSNSDSLDVYVRATAVVLDRVVTELELKQSRVHWEMTFANIPAPLAVINSKYEVLNSNPEFSKIAKLKCYQQFAGSERPCRDCPLFQAISTQKSQRGEIHIEDRVFEVHSNPIQFAGHLKSDVVVNYYLETTGQLELHGKLIQSEKMSALGLLAGNIAHELNNPLTGLQSMARVLTEDYAGQPEKETLVSDLKAIEDASIRCEKIISSLMDYVTPRPTALKEKVNLDELILKTMPMLKSALRLHRVESQLSLENQFVVANPQLLQQVVFNLINNAAQAMSEPGWIRLSTLLEHNRAVFEIQDSGPGVPEDVRDSLFEPFFTTKKQGHGTGLGLSISRSIVEGYGGSLVLKESRPGATVFRFELPVMRSE